MCLLKLTEEVNCISLKGAEIHFSAFYSKKQKPGNNGFNVY